MLYKAQTIIDRITKIVKNKKICQIL